MKLQLVSDLHHEVWERLGSRANASIPFVPEAELMLLAGDIGLVEDVIERYGKDDRPVIYVLGNHEFYYGDFADVRAKARRLCTGTNIHVLDNDEVTIGNVRVLGATLWTDFKLDCSQEQGMNHWLATLNDVRYMTHHGMAVKPQKILDEHNRSAAWLRSRLAIPFEGKTLVVSHHGCHPLGKDPQYAHFQNNSSFTSDLTELVEMADAWVFGHTHAGSQFKVGACSVYSNPRGYPRMTSAQKTALHLGNWDAPALDQPIACENPKFNPGFVFTL